MNKTQLRKQLGASRSLRPLPKTVLKVEHPLPSPVQDANGLWSQEIHVYPSKRDVVPDATVEARFRQPYLFARYDVVREDPRQALMFRELFGSEGSRNSDRFRMGLVELPRRTWIRLVFVGVNPPKPIKIKLTPYFKHD